MKKESRRRDAEHRPSVEQPRGGITSPLSKTADPTIFHSSKVRTDLPEGALGLPESVFEDFISDEEIQQAVKAHLRARKP